MKKILVAIAMLSSFASYSGELIVHTVSRHTEDVYALGENPVDRKINNNNAGIGYRTDDGYAFGAYRNSYHSNTVYVTKEFMVNDNFGVVFGASTGYKIASGMTITPMLAAIAKLPITDKISVNILAMPKVGKFIGVAHVAIAYKF